MKLTKQVVTNLTWFLLACSGLLYCGMTTKWFVYGIKKQVCNRWNISSQYYHHYFAPGVCTVYPSIPGARQFFPARRGQPVFATYSPY